MTDRKKFSVMWNHDKNCKLAMEADQPDSINEFLKKNGPKFTNSVNEFKKLLLGTANPQSIFDNTHEKILKIWEGIHGSVNCLPSFLSATSWLALQEASQGQYDNEDIVVLCFHLPTVRDVGTGKSVLTDALQNTHNEMTNLKRTVRL